MTNVGLFKPFNDLYHHLFYTLRDKRSVNLPLMGHSPLPLIALLTMYAAMVKVGPKLMRNRKPFELKRVMIFYNFTQIILNLLLAVSSTYVKFWKHSYNYECQPVDYSNSEFGLHEVIFTYGYLTLKLLDWFDTLFIILKKKDSQLSFLHTYHHSIVFAATYFALIWVPGGQGSPLGIINSYVHVIMYSYYLATCINPEMKKSIWWKRYITQVQLVQFLILSFYYTKVSFNTNCSYPKLYTVFYLSQSVFMLYLFSKFYVKAYLSKKVKK